MRDLLSILLFSILFSFMQCIEPYDPPEIDEFDDLLVIDANVNGTSGNANVSLSRAKALSDSEPYEYVSGALVDVIVENGPVYSLQAKGNGKYSAEGISLTYGDMVKIRITDADNVIYESKYEEFKQTPDIDSVSYDSDYSKVNFYVTTHDPNNNTFYYKWDFTETWEFRSAFTSGFTYYKKDTNVIVERREKLDTLNICFKSSSSNNIIISNSKRLSEDIISEFKIASISNATGKFAERYSILVKQRALSEETYKYWELLKANTENIGGLFDPQPSQLNSNVFNITEPSQKVIGYFNLYSETEKRINLVYTDVTTHPYNTEYDNCVYDTVLIEDMYDDLTIHYLITDLRNGPAPYAYLYSYPSCVDCRLKGTNKVPEFWK